MSVEIRNIMVDKVITTKKEATVEDAVKLMNKYEIGCLVVVENGKPVGIITERDLLKRVLRKSKELRNMGVTEIMSKPLVSIAPSVEIEEAAKLMFQKKIKKLPIVKKGKLLGLVTLTDILRIQPQLIRMYKIFSSDLAPRRMKKVFDYYLLVHTKFETVDINHLKRLNATLKVQ
ncbi:MAG: CBS domain-containing protein [Candidatus Bathyarchaeota archaeon]|nr:CBS domain-containing protein [Candidatus Bathyarchaeota archaeon]MDH5746608.1 CBS domain-containing protein [Candidatus Bathyarchaeota archaeon]